MLSSVCRPDAQPVPAGVKAALIRASVSALSPGSHTLYILYPTPYTLYILDYIHPQPSVLEAINPKSLISQTLRGCRALVVEDAVHGVHAAKGAGAFVVGITNSLPRAVLAEHAHAVVDTLVDFDPCVAPRSA